MDEVRTYNSVHHHINIACAYLAKWRCCSSFLRWVTWTTHSPASVLVSCCWRCCWWPWMNSHCCSTGEVLSTRSTRHTSLKQKGREGNHYSVLWLTWSDFASVVCVCIPSISSSALSKCGLCCTRSMLQCIACKGSSVQCVCVHLIQPFLTSLTTSISLSSSAISLSAFSMFCFRIPTWSHYSNHITMHLALLINHSVTFPTVHFLRFPFFRVCS